MSRGWTFLLEARNTTKFCGVKSMICDECTIKYSYIGNCDRLRKIGKCCYSCNHHINKTGTCEVRQIRDCLLDYTLKHWTPCKLEKFVGNFQSL